LIGTQTTNQATGTHTMAAILQFEQRTRPSLAPLPADHTAQILMYTGVRFERIDFDALKNAVTLGDSRSQEPARLAN
jgi:hypothetical protein